MMADIPIIFRRQMIRALLAGQKTMTRRLAWREVRRNVPHDEGPDLRKKGWDCMESPGDGFEVWGKPSPWQRVKPGDRLWAKERLCSHCHFGFPLSFGSQFQTAVGYGQRVWSYFADDVPEEITGGRPSIHCPRTYSRITILVTTTKMEPLQAIDEDDADAEGIVTIARSLSLHGRMDGYGAPGTPPEDASTTRVNGYRALWCKLHGTASWDENPEVVAMSGRVVVANIDSAEARHG